LLLKSDGTKMGKTERGALWLSAEKTSPYTFYQYWVNVADADAGVCLRYLTELTQEEVTALDNERAEQPHLRSSQKRLGEEVTRLVHGETGLAAAKRATEVLFGAAIENLSDAALGDIFADVPSIEVSRSRLSDGGMSLVDALVETQLAKSKSDARRTIEQSGAYINNVARTGVDTVLSPADLASETVMVVRSGRRKYALVRFK
jgi:tyrosyl-tRNA synthetase